MECTSLESLVTQLRGRLHGQPAGQDPGLDAALAGVRVDVAQLGPFLHFRPGRYTRNLLYRDACFELILNCWDAGALSPVHNHDGQECWFSIQAGTFQLENFPLLCGGRVPGLAQLGPPQCLGPVGVGYVDHRTPAEPVHRVRALSGPGLSLHVYARPLDSCLVYDVERGRCQLRALRYDSMFGRLVGPGVQAPAAGSGASA